MLILGQQINVTIGDLYNNRMKVLKAMEEAPRSNGPVMLVFPELTLTGYPPNDLLLQRGFVDEQLAQVEEIRQATAQPEYAHLYVVLGVALPNVGRGKPFHNSLLVFNRGVEVLRYHKQLLPTYNVFDENRYFEAGRGDQPNKLMIQGNNYGFLICEDVWNDLERNSYENNPVPQAMTDVKALITINASPSHTNKFKERYEMYTKLAVKYGKPIVYVNQVGAHDSLIFDGYSFVATPKGVTAAAQGFTEALLKWDVSVDSPLVGQPVDDYREIASHLVLGIRDYVNKNGFKSVVVGSSGGIDSAVVLALARMALGPDRVFAITMPSEYSSEGSVDDSEILCKNLGIKLYNRPIASEVAASIQGFEYAFGVKPSRLTIENEQARIRGRILMEFSNHFGSLVLSTGNKTEMSVGYCTIYGDMCGGLSVIADLYKMEVYALARWINDNYYVHDALGNRHGQTIPRRILDKEPSAELWGGQKDTDSLPPYYILDALLRLYIERDHLTPEQIAADTNLVKLLTVKDIEKYLKMTERAEFKRQQAPPILRVHKRAFGAGRVLPITQAYNPTYKNIL